MNILLTELERDAPVKVVSIGGGDQLRRKLEDMGISPGRELIKKGGQPFKGPVIVQVGTAQVAIGHGMAGKITVEKVVP